MRVKVRRPLVSIRNKVGMVKTTWTAPYPRDAYNALFESLSTLSKIVEL